MLGDGNTHRYQYVCVQSCPTWELPEVSHLLLAPEKPTGSEDAFGMTPKS